MVVCLSDFQEFEVVSKIQQLEQGSAPITQSA